ncbi:MAG: galactokinase [Saprospiraceae bacterium]
MYPDNIIRTYRERFGEAPALVLRAPGRINLIGEHTDYNEGFVLPAAIDRAIWMAVSPRSDATIILLADDFQDEYQGTLDQLQKSGKGWPDYLLGTFSELMKAGKKVGGVNVVYGGDIPLGAGLSSSAAVESGMLFALNELFQLGLSRPELARLAQRSENMFVGMQCGIMDMFASLMGRAGHALQLDCRSLEYRYYPVDFPDHTFFLCNSGVKHQLVDSEYNTRRQQCEEGVRLLQAVFPEIHSLRDVRPDMLQAERNQLPALVYKRCHYIVEENARVLAASQALEKGELEAFGELLYQAHRGAQTEFEISCPEVDFLVDLTRDRPEVLGSRMMGGGFGGCTINLVERSRVAEFHGFATRRYREAFGRDLPGWEVALTDGVGPWKGE